MHEFRQLQKLSQDTDVIEFSEFDWGFTKTYVVGDEKDIVSIDDANFRAMVRLMPADGGPRRESDLAQINLDNVVGGDSNYQVPDDKRRFSLNAADGAMMVLDTHVNEHGRASAFEFMPFSAKGLNLAIRTVQILLERLLLLYGTTTQVPIRFDLIVVERVTKPLLRAVTMRVGYPVVRVQQGFDFGGPSLGLIDYFGPHLVEALRTESPFWRVVCYYKVAYYYYGPLLNRFNKIRKELGLPFPAARVLPNAYPFDGIAVDMVGKKYKYIVNLMRAEFRNAFAHFSTDEPMQPLSAADEDAASRAAVILKKIAFDAIADSKRDVLALIAAGWTENSLRATLEAIDASERLT